MRTALLSLLLLAAACGRGELSPEDAHQQADQAASALVGALMKELNKSLSEGPPEHAIDVCGGAAQKITDRVRREQGIFVRRTSLRVRNPRNAPDDYERAWLERAASGGEIPSGGESEVVEGKDGHKDLRYVRPIRIAVYCTKCHGPAPSLRPEVRAILKERYPEDKAVGYKVGDLRGIISVRVPLD